MKVKYLELFIIIDFTNENTKIKDKKCNFNVQLVVMDDEGIRGYRWLL